MEVRSDRNVSADEGKIREKNNNMMKRFKGHRITIPFSLTLEPPLTDRRVSSNGSENEQIVMPWLLISVLLFFHLMTPIVWFSDCKCIDLNDRRP